MAHCLVANHVDHCWFTRFKRPFKRRDYLVRVFDMLAMTSHCGEDLVIPDILHHVERIGLVLEQRHRLETWTPRAVVPQDAGYRQLVTRRGFQIKAADSQSAVAHDQD